MYGRKDVVDGNIRIEFDTYRLNNPIRRLIFSDKIEILRHKSQFFFHYSGSTLTALTAPCILSCRLFPVGINKNYKTVVRMQLDPPQVNKPI